MDNTINIVVIGITFLGTMLYMYINMKRIKKKLRNLKVGDIFNNKDANSIGKMYHVEVVDVDTTFALVKFKVVEEDATEEEKNVVYQFSARDFIAAYVP